MDDLKKLRRNIVDDWIEVLSATQRRSLAHDLDIMADAAWNAAIDAAAELCQGRADVPRHPVIRADEAAGCADGVRKLKRQVVK